MRVNQKILLPIIITYVCLGVLGYFAIKIQLSHYNYKAFYNTAQMEAERIFQTVDNAASNAMEIASLFTQIPEIIDAFEIAHKGNIENETDDNMNQAREMLRKNLKSIMAGYTNTFNGEKLKLHFHLPNGRSLVRMWRDKQTKRNGEWLDISDDISEFRQTVLDVNKLGTPLKGIELGRGGFVLRGLVPIKHKEKQLGSAEVLIDFNPIIEDVYKSNVRKGYKSISLFMNSDKLPITTLLQNREAYPIVNNQYVYVYSSDDKTIIKDLIDVNLLNQGKQDLFVVQKNNMVFSAFPVKDYKSNQIGIMVYIYETKMETAIMNQIVFTQIGIILILLLILMIGIYFLLSKIIIKPVQELAIFTQSIAQGNLSKTMDVFRKDEIGQLFSAINDMVNGLKTIVTNVKNSGAKLVNASDTMKNNISTVISAVEQMNLNVNHASTKASLMSANMNTVAGATEQMSASIKSIDVHAKQGMSIARDAVDLSQKASSTMKSLGLSANQIGEVTEVIKRIADKTSLLALNADIEAATAGDAGKGFAVVANEIKEFAQQSTQAADDIANKISGMQDNTKDSVDVIGDITDIINNMSKFSENISSSLTQQTQAINEIAQNIGEATLRANEIDNLTYELIQKASEVSINVGIVLDDKQDTLKKDMSNINISANQVASLANELLELVDSFKI